MYEVAGDLDDEKETVKDDLAVAEANTGKVSDPESLLLYVGFDTPG
jgi:hypothetical protein